MSEKRRRSRRGSRAGATLEAGVAFTLALGRLACAPSVPAAPGTPAPAQPDPPAQAVQPAAAAPVDDELLGLLAREQVLSSAPARKTLYTWTTREQIEELAKDRVLLTREASPEHGPAFYDEVLAERAAAGDPLARRLRAPAFARARFAWPSPWATVLGWEGEGYGEELVSVQLKPEAWTAILSTSKAGLSVVDADNRPVPADEALRHPERIGAVYFVHDATPTKSAPPRQPYREYVLCNEAMIARWSIGTAESAGAVAGSLALVERLLAGLARRTGGARQLPVPIWSMEVARTTWQGQGQGSALDTAYEAALAFPNEGYQLDVERMKALVQRLRGITVHGPALAHVPAPAGSPPVAVQPLPPPVPKKPPPANLGGTWAWQRKP